MLPRYYVGILLNIVLWDPELLMFKENVFFFLIPVCNLKQYLPDCTYELEIEAFFRVE